MYCCRGFQNSIESAGHRGIATLVKETDEGICFVQQSRGIAFEDESEIRPVPGAPDIDINVSCTTGLRYCPFCGRQLRELVQTFPEAFAELAEEHKKFLARDEI
jgi:hypothetical protein